MPDPPLHRQGRGGQDLGGRRHRPGLRRRRPADAGPVHRPGPLAGRQLRRRARRVATEAVAKRLRGQQLDAQERMEESWDEIQRWLIEVFNWAGVDAIEAEELAVVPGLDEVFALGDIKTYADVGGVGHPRRRLRADGRDDPPADACPTSCAGTWSASSRSAAASTELVGPVLCRGDEAAGAPATRCSAPTGAFYDRLDGVRELLSDPTRASVRLVVNPERMVIAEARRTYTYLSPVRLPGRRGGRQPAAARRGHRSRGSPRGRRPRPSTWPPSTRASRRCRSCGPAGRRRARRRRPACARSPTSSTAARSGRRAARPRPAASRRRRRRATC